MSGPHITWKRSEDLQPGDTLRTLWKGRNSTIAGFREYTGPLDFVLKIAVFTDGSSMSLQKETSYQLTDWFYGP